jgi:hypothetical protein
MKKDELSACLRHRLSTEGGIRAAKKVMILAYAMRQGNG